MKFWKKPNIMSVTKMELSNHIIVAARSGVCYGWFMR